MKIINAILAPIELMQAKKKCRKTGQRVDASRAGITVLPVFDMGASIFDTVEGCALRGQAFTDVYSVFKLLSPETRQTLAFSPNAEEIIDRVRFWQTALKPILPPKRYHAAMGRIIHCYARIHRLGADR